MPEQPEQYTHIILQNSYATSYYSEQEAAHYSHLEIQEIRYLTNAGVLSNGEVVGEARRYSEEDIALLRRAHRLYHDLDINLEGIEVILRLSARLEALQRELEHYRGQIIEG